MEDILSLPLHLVKLVNETHLHPHILCVCVAVDIDFQHLRLIFGNFPFAQTKKRRSWYVSLVVTCKLHEQRKGQVKIISLHRVTSETNLFLSEMSSRHGSFCPYFLASSYVGNPISFDFRQSLKSTEYPFCYSICGLH